MELRKGGSGLTFWISHVYTEMPKHYPQLEVVAGNPVAQVGDVPLHGPQNLMQKWLCVMLCPSEKKLHALDLRLSSVCSKPTQNLI
jgi:hypothetical protein